MKRIACLVAAAAVCALAVSACGATPVRVGADDDGGSVTLKKGAVLTVALPGNPSTGYAWQPVFVPPGLRPDGEWTFEPDSEALGAGGTMTLSFEAVAPGTGTLELEYARAWEETAPLDTFSLKVTVTE